MALDQTLADTLSRPLDWALSGEVTGGGVFPMGVISINSLTGTVTLDAAHLPYDETISPSSEGLGDDTQEALDGLAAFILAASGSTGGLIFSSPTNSGLIVPLGL